MQHWFEAGGDLTLSALDKSLDSAESYSRYLDDVGANYPVRVLEPTVEVAGGLLGAAARGVRAPFDAIAQQLHARGFALVELGDVGASWWPRVCAEGRQLWPAMRPGILESQSEVGVAKTTEGLSPSGAARGDRFIASSEAAALPHGPWPALAELDSALALVGTLLNEALGGALVLRSDPFFACFPGGGSQYGAHFDAAKLTTILYCNPGWEARQGGALHLLDEGARCWHAVLPTAGRLLLFDSPSTLHRVEPVLDDNFRFALSAWWFTSPRGERLAEGQMKLVRSHFPVGHPERLVPFVLPHEGGQAGELGRSAARALLERQHR